MQLEHLYDRDSTITGVPTGFHDLDDLLLGLQPSTLNVLAARPGQGKTSLALGAALHCALVARKPVLFFSMEMGHLELTKRLLAAEAGIEARKLSTGKLSEHEWPKLHQAVGRLAEAPFFIDDNPHCTVMEMRAKARRTRARFGDLGLIVVDYLQLMSSSKRVESRQIEVSEMSRGLKILARELDTPVLCLSQLNRQLEYRQDKRPMLADLRESGLPHGRHRADARRRHDRHDGRAVRSRRDERRGPHARRAPAPRARRHDARVRERREGVFELRLASGRSVTASANHPFLTVDGWVQVAALAPGRADRVDAAAPSRSTRAATRSRRRCGTTSSARA